MQLSCFRTPHHKEEPWPWQRMATARRCNRRRTCGGSLRTSTSLSNPGYLCGSEISLSAANRRTCVPAKETVHCNRLRCRIGVHINLTSRHSNDLVDLPARPCDPSILCLSMTCWRHIEDAPCPPRYPLAISERSRLHCTSNLCIASK